MSIKSGTTLCLFLLVLYSCTGNRRLPSSTGQPYEVVVESDEDSIVTRILTADCPHLPQPEPFCNLIKVKKAQARGSFLLVRTRVVVDINRQNKGYQIKMIRNVNAQPQTVIRLQASSAQELQKHLDGERLRCLIDSIELEHLASVVKQNAKKQKEIKQRFGLSIKVPASMQAEKKGKDFLWLSNNASTGMQSLLIFRVKTDSIRGNGQYALLTKEINRVLQANMPGETDGMFMQLCGDASVQGMWQMKGDDMGGPYVMKIISLTGKQHISDRGNKNVLVVMGFVYAPDMKKRNLIKQLEAIVEKADMAERAADDSSGKQ